MRDRCCKPKSCTSPANEIVYPTQEEFVKTYSEETVKHIHPIHTTVVNCHTVKNEHLYPHTTSYENVVNEVNVGNNTDVAGVMDNFGPGFQGMGSGSHGQGKCCKRRRRRGWF